MSSMHCQYPLSAFKFRVEILVLALSAKVSWKVFLIAKVGYPFFFEPTLYIVSLQWDFMKDDHCPVRYGGSASGFSPGSVHTSLHSFCFRPFSASSSTSFSAAHRFAPSVLAVKPPNENRGKLSPMGGAFPPTTTI